MIGEEIYDKVFDEVYETIKANEPTVKIENTGIGSYEYWGAKGFDKGKDIAYVEDDTLVVSVDFPGTDVALLTEVAEIINEEKYESTVEVLDGRKTYDVPYAVTNARVEDNKIIVDVEWKL